MPWRNGWPNRSYIASHGPRSNCERSRLKHYHDFVGAITIRASQRLFNAISCTALFALSCHGRPANGLQAQYRPGCLPFAVQGARGRDGQISITPHNPPLIHSSIPKKVHSGVEPAVSAVDRATDWLQHNFVRFRAFGSEAGRDQEAFGWTGSGADDLRERRSRPGSLWANGLWPRGLWAPGLRRGRLRADLSRVAASSGGALGTGRLSGRKVRGAGAFRRCWSRRGKPSGGPSTVGTSSGGTA